MKGRMNQKERVTNNKPVKGDHGLPVVTSTRDDALTAFQKVPCSSKPKGLTYSASNDCACSVIYCLFAINEIRDVDVPRNGTEFMKGFSKLLRAMGSDGYGPVDTREFFSHFNEARKNARGSRSHHKSQVKHDSILMFLIEQIEKNFEMQSVHKGELGTAFKSIVENKNIFTLPASSLMSQESLETAFKETYCHTSKTHSKYTRNQIGTKTLTVQKFPFYLIISFNSYDESQNVKREACFSETLTIGDRTKFKLFAICQQSLSNNGDDYTAMVLDEKDGNWYLCDNNNVSKSAPPGKNSYRKSYFPCIMFYRFVTGMGREQDQGSTSTLASERSKKSGIYARESSPKLEDPNSFPYSAEVACGKQSRSDGCRGRRPRSHSLGLRNYGSNCYINSIVQCLFAIDEIRSMEVSDSTSEFMKIFKSLLEDMGSEMRHPVEPSTFLNQIRKVTKRFANYRQQDAHSFLIFLIKEIDENFAKLSSDYKGLFSATMETSYEYKCPQSHKASLTEVIKTFVLPCNENTENTFKDKYLKFKGNTGEMFCSTCQRMRFGKTASRLASLPSYLIILLSRFDLRTGLKDSSATQFPLSMTIESKRVGQKFKLFAVSSHHGSMVSYGHFTATVVNKDDDWYHYDDERVSPSGPPGDSLSRQTAYILFYRRVIGEEMTRRKNVRESTNQGGSKRSASHKLQKGFGCGRLDPKMEVQHSFPIASSKHTARGRQLESSASEHRRARSHSAGLRNIESNDYINSIVQCLFAINEIRNIEVADHGSEFIKSFKKLMIDMGSEQSDNQSVDPRIFLKWTKRIANRFASYRQQDAHSFLLFLIREIDENSSLDFKGIFSGVMQRKSEYFCSKPEQHSTVLDENINTFILPCDKNVVESFKNLYLFQRGNERMFCSGCQREVHGCTTSTLIRFPWYLIILLSRFHLMTGQKDLSETQFPLIMTFGNKCEFKLFAICDHHGSSTRGHFTAKVLDKMENQWYCYDDESCSSTKAPNTDGNICKSSIAYILFYENIYRSTSFH